MVKQPGIGTHDLFSAEIGDVFVPEEFVITGDIVDRNSWACDDYNPWYMKESPFGGRIASPVSLTARADIMFWNHYIFPACGGLHAKQEYEFFKPLPMGKKLKMTGKLMERYTKRGRDYFAAGNSVFDEEGEELIRMKAIHAFPLVARTE